MGLGRLVSRPTLLRAGLLALASFAALPAEDGAAAPLAFRGTLRLDIGRTSSTIAITIPAAGVAGVGGVGFHLTSLTLPAGIASSSGVVPVTDPAAFPIQGFTYSLGNGAGSFAETPGGHLGGVLPLAGMMRFCLFGPCSGPPPANLTVPLAPVGVGGSATAMGGAANVTVVGAPWTTGTVAARTSYPPVTAMGFRHGPASASSSTARPSGVLQLVTPFLIYTNIGTVPLPAIATLTLHFVPEPGTAVLLGLGITLLAARGRRAHTTRD
jgi:hypothetical protein